MKLEKAIEILEHPPSLQDASGCHNHSFAIKIGIEALKRIEHCRKWSHYAVREPLTGETIGQENP